MKIKDIVASNYFDIDNDEDAPEAIIYYPTVNVFVDSLLTLRRCFLSK